MSLKSENPSPINMLDDCINVLSVNNCPFNDWEQGFIESMEERVDDGRNLTEDMERKIKEIWDKI